MIKRSFAEATAASKSAFSSGPNRSSNDALAFRRRVFLAGAAVRRVLRTGAGDDSVAGLRVVLRVFRTGRSSVATVGAAVRRVLRTGAAGSGRVSCAGLRPGLIAGLEALGEREGPRGGEPPGGPDVVPVGGPRLRAGGPCRPPAGGPRLGAGEGERDGGLRVD